MRALVLSWRLLPLIISFLRDWRRWIWRGAPLARSDAFHRRRAQRLVRELAACGPSFVKLAQVFASRADLIAEPYLGELSTLVDRVPPVPIEHIRRAVREEYGRTTSQLFERFDEEPIAAASLGQVHRARYHGEEVVLKVLRPGVAELVRKDMGVALPFLRWMARRYPNAHVRSALAVVEEFSHRVFDEMDFRKEAANAVEIHANFEGMSGVRIPRVVPELVRQTTLVLEYMEGQRIDTLSASATNGRDPRTVVQRVMQVYLRMMLVDGFFHADPHPGNLLVQSDGTLVVLDFGMAIRVLKQTRRDLVQTVFAAIRRDVDGIVAGFDALGLIDPNVDRAEIRTLASELLSIAYNPGSLQERIDLLTQRVLATLYDWPIVLSSEMVYFARTAALIEGLGVRYDRNFNPIVFATPIAIEMRADIMKSLGHLPASGIDWATLLGGALGWVSGVAQRLGASVLRYFRDEPGETPVEIWRGIRGEPIAPSKRLTE